MKGDQGSTAAYYRNTARRIRDLARTAQLLEVRHEMFELAERFDRMASFVEKRYPDTRGRRSPPIPRADC
jgi:hypothetical protein